MNINRKVREEKRVESGLSRTIINHKTSTNRTFMGVLRQKAIGVSIILSIALTAILFVVCRGI